jgi:hypothetical protein
MAREPRVKAECNYSSFIAAYKKVTQNIIIFSSWQFLLLASLAIFYPKLANNNLLLYLYKNLLLASLPVFYTKLANYF